MLTGVCTIQFVCVFMRKINPLAGWHGYALFYFVLGFVSLGIHKRHFDKIKSCWLVVFFFLALLCQTLLNIYLLDLSPELRKSLFADELVFGGYRSIFVVIMVLTMVLILGRMQLPNSRIITGIGKNTFGIYVFQDIIYKILCAYTPSIVDYGILFPLLVFLLCYILCLLFNRTKLGYYLIHI